MKNPLTARELAKSSSFEVVSSPQFTLEDATKITGIGVRLGEVMEHIRNQHGTVIDVGNLVEEMRQYETMFKPIVEQFLGEMKQSGRDTYGLEKYLV